MERKKEDRSLLLYLLLGIVTCGIYALIFFWNLIKDLNDVCRVKEEDDSEKSPNYLILVLLTLVTCGLYLFYWFYKQGNRIRRVGELYGEHIDENGSTYLLWLIFGAFLCGAGPLVGYHLFFKNVNKLCRAYNKEYIDGAGGNQNNGYQNNGYQNGGNQNNGYQNGGYQNGGNQNNGYQNGSYRNGGNQNNGYQNNSYQNGGNQNGGSFGKQADQGAYRENVNTQAATIGVQQGELVCTRGGLQGAQIPIRSGEVIMIGRDGTVCNLILADMDISRRHCAVQFGSNELCYFVTDYSSTGVRMNGSPIPKNVMTKCPRGTKILLGSGSNEFLLK